MRQIPYFRKEFAAVLADALGEEWILSERQVLSLLDWIRRQAGGSRSAYPFLVTLAEGQSVRVKRDPCVFAMLSFVRVVLVS
ncbi:hypothetical protein GTX14_18490 [Streptomyces sp. SID4944]|nr:hypothetical protein [Streptomyces sp. SID4944]